ncbi:MAG: hypothetical protein C0613_06365 [Desulfobulbaceae bacterium]|nr:MAG: hypothetical protein C0613_06365 [Desulfobulbaceae bacterium]
MTRKMGKMVPELRFPEFEGEWEATQLSKLSSQVTSGSRDWAQFYTPKGDKFIRMTNLPRDGNIRLILDDMKYVTLPLNSSDGLRTSLKTGDILISITAELGKIGLIPENFGKAYINQHIALVKPRIDLTAPTFVAYFLALTSSNNRFNRLNDSGAKAGLNLKTIRAFEVNTPPLPEQQKIAAFLSAVDGKIQQLSRQKELLEQYKKGVMQKIFSQQIRFAAQGRANVAGAGRAGATKDDNGQDYPDWREKRLGDLVTKIGSGVTPKGGAKVYQDEGVIFIRSQNVNSNRLLLDDITYISSEMHNSMKSSEVYASDILLNITGASIGRSCVVPANFTTGNVNQHVCIIRMAEEASEYFYQIFLSSYYGQKLIFQSQAGGGREGLNFQNIRTFKVPYPSYEEQQKIALFLTGIDQKIEAVQNQLTQSQTFKKGLLQKMFV